MNLAIILKKMVKNPCNFLKLKVMSLNRMFIQFNVIKDKKNPANLHLEPANFSN